MMHPVRTKHYRPCAQFMERGGIYGRSRHYPYIAGRLKRIFRTAIHVRFGADEKFRRNTFNSQALNAQAWHPLFAYEFRPGPWHGIPGGGGQCRTTPVPTLSTDDSKLMRMDFRIEIELPKAA